MTATEPAATVATAEPACIGFERAPVDAKELVVSCPRKAGHQCCGHHFCAEHYRRHRAGVHPPKWTRQRAQ